MRLSVFGGDCATSEPPVPVLGTPEPEDPEVPVLDDEDPDPLASKSIFCLLAEAAYASTQNRVTCSLEE